MRSIRSNLILWLSVALGAATLVVLAATYTYARAQLNRVLDQELR